MRHFPILQILWGGGRGGGGSKSSIMIATLKRIERNSKPPIPLKTRIRHVKAKTCHLFGGRWGGGGVNDKFLSILSKNSSSQG